MGLYRCVWPSVFLQVVVSSGLVGMVDLLPLCRPHEDTSLTGLFGQAVVDVRDDGEGGALWVAQAHVDPVISETQQSDESGFYLIRWI